MASQKGEQDQPNRADVEAAAYRFLGRRDYAVEELARKLRQKELPEGLIDEVLESLQQAGYLDDQRFALVQGAILARKNWGPRQISHKLRARGVSETVVEEALSEIGRDVDWTASAKERLHDRFGRAEELDDDQRPRAFRHLTYRGFAPALIRRLLFDY